MGRPLRQTVMSGQGKFEDLGRPLSEITFCVVDLETTGVSPTQCAITEIGAVRLQGGERVGSFQTLVDPGCRIPPRITVMTGITEAMVVDAPTIDSILPTFLEFLGDAVVVGHNVRFDLSFLKSALERSGRPNLTNRVIDTCALSRRLLCDEVPNHKLGTLAAHLRLDHQPSHRALDDALAAGDLLHALLERVSSLGITGLEDLLKLPRLAGHPQSSKLRLTENLPRKPGIYMFRNQRSEVLYVGRATNLRSRVRSYFSSDSRRKVHQLLRQTTSIEYQVCATPLEAAVLEIRLIHEHEPHYNHQGTTWRRYAYVKLSLGEQFPRLSAARVLQDDGALYIGPVASTKLARQVIAAIEAVVPLRRCSLQSDQKPGKRPCLPAQLGAAACPCTGVDNGSQHAACVEWARLGLTRNPSSILRPLEARMLRLAKEERFEEAAAIRDQAAALANTVARHRRLGQLCQSGRLRVRIAGHSTAEFHCGTLVGAWSGDLTGSTISLINKASPADIPTKEEVDELNCVASWLHRNANQLVIEHCDGLLSEPVNRLPEFRTKHTR